MSTPNVSAANAAVNAARSHYRALCERPESLRDCEFCCGDTEHREDDAGEYVCMPCEMAQIVRMADAARDVRGWAAYNRDRRS